MDLYFLFLNFVHLLLYHLSTVIHESDEENGQAPASQNIVPSDVIFERKVSMQNA